MDFLAQAPDTNTWVNGGIGAILLTLVAGMLKWIMVTVEKKFDALNASTLALHNTLIERSRSLERSVDHCTRAMYLLAIGLDTTNSTYQAKLQECLKELNEKEALIRAKADQGGS